MDQSRWKQVEALYHAALEQEPRDRRSFVRQAAPDDEDLRREVESLLRQDVSGASPLDRPAWHGAESLFENPSSSDGEIERGDAAEAPGNSQPDRRRHPFTWFVLLAAVATAAAFAYGAWSLARDRGVPAYFGWAQLERGGVWYVAGVDSNGPAAGLLQSGDRLLSLDGDAAVSRAGTRSYRRSLKIGQSYELGVDRDGTTYNFTLGVVAGDRRLAAALAWYFVSLVWCGVGLFIGFARPDRLEGRLAFLASLATGLVFLRIGTVPVEIYLWQPLHVVLGYHFFYRFPSEPPRGKAWSALLGVCYLTGAVGAVAHQPLTWLTLTQGPGAATSFRADYGRLLDAAWILALFSFFAAVIGMVAVTARNYRLIEDVDQARRIRWVVYAAMAGLAPEFWWGAVASYEALVGPASVSRFSLAVCAATVVIPLAVAYAVVKHRVLDIKVAVRMGLQYVLAKRALQALLALPLLAISYTLVVNRDQTIAELATDTRGYLFWLAVAALSLRYGEPLRRWLDSKFFQEQYDREQVLVGLLDDLGGVESIEALSRLVCSKLDLALHPKTMYLWFRKTGEVVLTHSSGRRLAAPTFPADGRLLSLLEGDSALVEVPLPAAALSRSEVRWLDDAEARLIVPLKKADDGLIGILLLGEKKSEEPYDASDRRLLRTIAGQAAVMHEHLRLRDQVSEEQRVRRDVLAKLDPRLGLLKECPACGACFDPEATLCAHDHSELTLSLPISRTVDGKYRLDQLIGKGGMGAVYEALDLRLDRVVAVKIMVGKSFGERRALQRFEREARATARLSHPNIVRVHDFGVLASGGAYLVMERIYGRTLREEMERDGPLPPAAVADWASQILEGIAAAHEQGVIHRDLKPENVLGCRTSGALLVRILDFGLAKLRLADAPAADGPSLTEAGVVIGTFGYMAPEQLLRREVDQRTDIFAIGVMLAEMLTGRRPFQGETHGEVLQAVLHDSYSLPRDLPGLTSAGAEAVGQAVERCLAKNIDDRYDSASELRRQLISALPA